MHTQKNYSCDISFTASEMLRSILNARAKSVKVILYNCLTELSLHNFVPKQQHPPPKVNDRVYCVRLLVLRCKYFIMYKNEYIQYLILLFLVTFSASLSGCSDFVLFDSLDGNGAYSQCFMRYSSFAYKLNVQLWMETRLTIEIRKIFF